MNVDRLIQVCVDTGRDRDRYKVASGYPIARNLILTARHALADAGQAIDVGSVEVRWIDAIDDDARRFRPIDTIAWDGEKEAGVDAVLIRCGFSEDLVGSLRPTEFTPLAHARWNSRGFPEAGKDEARNFQPVALIGEVIEARSDASIMTLGVKFETSLKDGWRGASGGPVIIDGQLVGLLETCPVHFDNRVVKAVAMRHLLANPAFCALVRDYDEEAQTAIRKLAARLQPYDDVCRKLLELLGKGGGSATAMATAEALLGTSRRAALSALDEAWGNLDETRGDAKLGLFNAALCLAPAHANLDHKATLRRAHGACDGKLVPVHAYWRLSAEIQVAAAHDRAAIFVPDGSEDPRGELAFEMPAQFGIEDPERHCVDAVEDYLSEEAKVPKNFKQDNREKAIKQFVDERIGWKAAPYCIVEGGDDAASRICDGAARQLGARYPRLLIVRTSDDQALWLDEQKDYEPLRHMIRRWTEMTK